MVNCNLDYMGKCLQKLVGVDEVMGVYYIVWTDWHVSIENTSLVKYVLSSVLRNLSLNLSIWVHKFILQAPLEPEIPTNCL